MGRAFGPRTGLAEMVSGDEAGRMASGSFDYGTHDRTVSPSAQDDEFSVDV